jgi:endoglucanase
MSRSTSTDERSLDARPAQAQRPPQPKPARRRSGVVRRVMLATLVLLLIVGGIAILSIEGSRQNESARGAVTLPLQATARADARSFLQRYETSSGRVVRKDQGGDTVSEGQSYAMLVAVAIGARQQFAAAWRWDQSHLQLPDGLFAYHWKAGKVVNTQPPTDADLDTAWALVLASQRFHNSLYLSHGLQVASAVLADETTVVAGKLQLVAGPWARSSPAVADPSYFSLAAMDSLERVSGDARWSQLATDSTMLVSSLTSAGHTLPANWVDIEATGSAQAIGGPSTPNSTPAYGLDAQRVPVWFAAGCTQSQRSVAANAWPLLRRAADQGGRISYSLRGAAQSAAVNPLGSVAAAASASAAGDQRAAATLLTAADRQSARFQTYYGDAWVALGRILLDTSWLSPCAPGAGSS